MLTIWALQPELKEFLSSFLKIYPELVGLHMNKDKAKYMRVKMTDEEI
jgi:hypothetical protein